MSDTTTVIRPSAILADRVAKQVLDALVQRDVSKGGVWSASAGLWQRYDKPWDGATRGTARLLGSIGTVYGTPSKYDITIYRVTLTDARGRGGLDRRHPLRRRPAVRRPHPGPLPAHHARDRAADPFRAELVRQAVARRRTPYAPRG